MNEKGNYVLVTLKTTENYYNLEESLADLTEEMSKLNKVKVRGKSSNIKYFLGGDWKFPACVCGLGGANQEYACIWCKCPHNQRHIKRVWSLSNSSQGGFIIGGNFQICQIKKVQLQGNPSIQFHTT